MRGKFSSQKMSNFLLSGLNRPSTLTEINEKSAIPFELSPFFAAGGVAWQYCPGKRLSRQKKIGSNWGREERVFSLHHRILFCSHFLTLCAIFFSNSLHNCTQSRNHESRNTCDREKNEGGWDTKIFPIIQYQNNIQDGAVFGAEEQLHNVNV